MTVGAILTDIEGTTSSIAFVKEVLFPYAREHLPRYVREHASQEAVLTCLRNVWTESSAEEGDVEAAIQTLVGWIDEDRKATPLKALQGMIWEAGYRNGDYVAHMYPDAVEHLGAWHEAGIPIYVYSSGSVPAQKLFFGFSEAGDLTPLFSGYFDTTTGPKKDKASYQLISQSMGVAPQDILFLSDVEAELDAARAAGMRTTWLIRDGALPPDPAHAAVKSFNDIVL